MVASLLWFPHFPVSGNHRNLSRRARYFGRARNKLRFRVSSGREQLRKEIEDNVEELRLFLAGDEASKEQLSSQQIPAAKDKVQRLRSQLAPITATLRDLARKLDDVQMEISTMKANQPNDIQRLIDDEEREVQEQTEKENRIGRDQTDKRQELETAKKQTDDLEQEMGQTEAKVNDMGERSASIDTEIARVGNRAAKMRGRELETSLLLGCLR